MYLEDLEGWHYTQRLNCVFIQVEMLHMYVCGTDCFTLPLLPCCPSPLQKGGQDAVRVNAPEHMQSVANLLGVAAKDLEVSVTNKVTFTRGELFCTPLTVDQALDTRQAEEQFEDQYSTLL